MRPTLEAVGLALWPEYHTECEACDEGMDDIVEGLNTGDIPIDEVGDALQGWLDLYFVMHVLGG